MKFIQYLKDLTKPLFNTRAAGVYILLFALAIGGATFVENDFGTSAAQKIIFKSWWFELLLVLFSITILVNVFKFRMIQQKKWSLFIFHVSIVIILIGAGVTRYFSYEGIMHIREGKDADSFLSSDTYLQFQVSSDGKYYEFDEPVLFASLGRNKFDESYKVGNDIINVKLNKAIPNPKQQVENSNTGTPTIKIVIGGAGGRQEYYLKEGEKNFINGLNFNFTKEIIPDAFNIFIKNDSLFFKSGSVFTQMTMATKQLDTLVPAGQPFPLKLRSLYSDGQNNFVIGDYFIGGEMKIVSEKPKMESESVMALGLTVTINGKSSEHYLYGQKGVQGNPIVRQEGAFQVAISYGSKPIRLPFKIALKDFIMERYPGTNSAASYASEVKLFDPRNNEKLDYRIFMNNILDYDGYRFFQSSYDQDEGGTYLSVNHDFLGTWISYIGYALLTLGMMITLLSKKTRFYQLSQQIKALRAKRSGVMMILFCLVSLRLMHKPRLEQVLVGSRPNMRSSLVVW